MIGDNTKAADLLKKMRTNPNMYFLFDPKGHYVNAQALYASMKRQVSESFFGRANKKTNEQNPYKGTVFEKCQLPNEIFNVNRMVKMNIKQSLSRFGYLALRDGKLEINEKGRPDVVDMQNIL